MGKIRKGLEAILAVGAANLGAVYGVAELIDRSDFSDPTNGLIMMASGAAIAGGNYFALRSRGLKRTIGKINSMLDLKTPISVAKTVFLLGALAFSGHNLKPYADQIREDFSKPEVESVLEPAPVLKSNARRPAVYGNLGYSNIVNVDFSGTGLAQKESSIGRIQRTLRWEPIYSAVERNYGIPKGILTGMIMQESYGNPVQPNSGNDGGLGITHIQGPVAKNYGLKIFGQSNSSSDRNHGAQLRKMLSDCNYDATCAQKFDDRAHMIKALDVAARIVSEGKNKHGNWDFGVEYYRAPGKVGKNLTWKYLQKVKRWREDIQDPKLFAEAASDFKERNGYDFSKYLSRWHSTANNWGLEVYNRSR